MNKDIIEAITCKLGAAEDNLYRARTAFRGCDPEQMQQRYGASESTRAEIVEQYEDQVKRWKKALEEVQGK